VNDRADRLAARTLALVDIASESYDEAAILGWLRDHAPVGRAFVVADDHDACLVHLPERRRQEASLVLLAGHVDTVPIAGNVPGRREGGDVVGRGAADMKAALAVMLEVMEAIATGALASDLDVGFLWFGREEVSTDESALLPLFARRPELAEAALAVMMEPTDNALEVGCLGNLNARVTVTGTAAHSARPWHGDNAIHGAIDALASIADLPVRDVTIDGLTYREVVNVTTIEGGIAANVIPDRAVATVNFRYAPNHTPEAAEVRIRELLGNRRAEVEILSNARPGPVTVRNPLVERLRVAGALDVRPKQAWTPVAEFAEVGVDAVNCGPGDPRYAHRDDERVTVAALVRSFEVLAAFLSAGPSAGAAPEGMSA
jgi:succinyl-diaminopimelate desuccinylase